MRLMSPNKPKSTGTFEWSDATFNSQKGCINNCVYGYCKNVMAPRFRLMPKLGWEHPEYRTTEWIKKHIQEKQYQELTPDQVIMYPSMHDFTPDNIDLCIWTIQSLLIDTKARLLLVSKPRKACIEQIIRNDIIDHEKNRIEFRFTIGSKHYDILHKWEPSATEFVERCSCMEIVLQKGFKLSISCEPLLDEDCGIVDWLLGYTDFKGDIWIGSMNYRNDAPKLDYPAIYQKYKDNPRIRFKESFRRHLKGI